MLLVLTQRPQPETSRGLQHFWMRVDPNILMLWFTNKKFSRVSTPQLALFVTFSLYYVFNLEYPDDAKGVFLFLQDYILEQPDRSKKLPCT